LFTVEAGTCFLNLKKSQYCSCILFGVGSFQALDIGFSISHISKLMDGCHSKPITIFRGSDAPVNARLFLDFQGRTHRGRVVELCSSARCAKHRRVRARVCQGWQLYQSGCSHCVHIYSLFVWLVADGWCWFVLRVKYCWLIAGGLFVLREKYCWLVADKPNEQGARYCKKLHSAAARTPCDFRVAGVDLCSAKQHILQSTNACIIYSSGHCIFYFIYGSALYW
jgi:hypothetical protein